MQPDAVLGVGAIKDGNAVAIGDFDELAGEGVGGAFLPLLAPA